MAQEKRYRYRGVNTFRKEDEDIFQGRDDAKEQLFTRIMLSKTLVMHGESGLGKSSLIQAGIVPKLEREQPDYLAVVISLDFSNVMAEEESKKPESLLDVILDKIKKESGLSDEPFFPFLGEPADGLWLLAKKIAFKQRKLLLFFDQFEELQTFSKNEIAIFKRELSELLNSQIPPAIYKAIRKYKNKILENTKPSAEERAEFNSNIQFLEAPLEAKAVFAVREDKLGTMSLLSDVFPDILKNDLILNPLTRDEAFLAITVPAQVTGNFKSKPFGFESDQLVKDKVADIAGDDPNVDPIQLQLVCRNIEESLVIKKRRSTISADEFPSVKDTITRFYWRNWDAVKVFLQKSESDTDLKLKRKEIITLLVVNGRRNMVHSDLLIHANTAKEDKGIIGILCSNGLIREIPAGMDNYYQLCHDRFIEPLQDDLKTLSGNEELLQEISVSEKVAKEQRRKIKQLFAVSILLGLVILGIGATILIWARFRATNDRLQSEFIGSVKSLRRDNPTLAYEQLREFQSSLGTTPNDSLQKYLDRFESVNDAYLRYTFPVNSTPIQAISSKDGNSLTLADRNVVTTWDVRSGKIVDLWKLRYGNYVRTATVNGTSYWVIYGRDSTIDVEDQGGNIQTILRRVPPAKNIDISSDGKYVLAGDIVYDNVTKKQIGRLPVAPGKTGDLVVSIFMHDNRHIAAGYYSGYKAIFELGRKITTTALIPPGEEVRAVITSLTVDSKDRFLIAGKRNNDIEVWKIDSLPAVDERSNRSLSHGTGNPFLSVLTGHTGEINTVSVSANDSMIMSGSKDHTAIVWDLHAHNKLAILKGMSDEVTFARFFRDSRTMVTATKKGLAYVWTYGKAGSICRQYGGMALFTPFDHYNIEYEQRTEIFRKHYDTTGIENLFSRTLQYICNMPSANSRPTEEEYRDNLQYSINEIDSMYGSLTHSPAFALITPANKAMLYQVYADLWLNRGDLLVTDRAESVKEVVERSAQYGLIMKEKALVDSDITDAENAVGYLYSVGKWYSDSLQFPKSNYYLSQAAFLTDSFFSVDISLYMKARLYTTLANAYLYENLPDSALSVARKMGRAGFSTTSAIINVEAYLLKNDLVRARRTIRQQTSAARVSSEEFTNELQSALEVLADRVQTPAVQKAIDDVWN